ncbi:peptidoglycan-binding protein [Pedobacter antarcticus]|uniref:peptidoglycan-binding protein n=1 Tax=Pedobacter antarcticus TaxID=34086 RepID=UPI0029310038|nr:peptidoglycan-binding protein [Pedobacter antarcticus]
MSGRNLLIESPAIYPADTAMENDCRAALIRIARAEIGVRELTGKNDGLRVEEYLAVAGLKKGQPWCAAFVSWVFRQEGFHQPITGWSPSLFPASRLTSQLKEAQVFGIYIPQKKRIAHAGIIEKIQGDWYLSIEGNTNVYGSIEGDGVYHRKRHLKTSYRTADWVKITKTGL